MFILNKDKKHSNQQIKGFFIFPIDNNNKILNSKSVINTEITIIEIPFFQ
jgi:hypothetical protein